MQQEGKKKGTNPPKITDALVQPRRKDAVDVAKDRLGVAQTEFPAEEADHACEALGGADLEDALREARGGADRVEADCYYAGGESGGVSA